jgi:hypothetical protein
MKTRSLLETPAALAWLLASAVAIAGSASAADDTSAKQPAVDDIGALFDKLDSDHSAGIDRAEAEKLPGLSEVFSKYDKDNDGTLDADELAKALAAITK